MVNHIPLALQSWDRFRIRNFAVEPDLQGKSLEFAHREHQVQIQLPSVSTDLSDDELLKRDINQEGISFNSYKEIEGRKVPSFYWIYEVDVYIVIPDLVNLPEEILSRPPKAFDILSEAKQKYLDGLAEKYGELAESAIDIWIRVMRWKCGDSSIGRPEIHGVETGWSTYLIQNSIKQRVWASTQGYRVEKVKVVSGQEWNDVEDALKNNLMPPVYYDLMFDGEEHLKHGDLQRAVVDFAVACESCLRIYVGKNLSKGLSHLSKKQLDETNIRQVLTKIFPTLLRNDQKQAFNGIEPKLHQLFDDRNTIMHSGQKENLTVNKCYKHRETTRRLIAFINQL